MKQDDPIFSFENGAYNNGVTLLTVLKLLVAIESIYDNSSYFK